MIAAITGSIFLMALVVIYTGLIFGAPWGEYALGGRHKILVGRERLIALFALMVQLLGIFVLLRCSGIITGFISDHVAKIMAYIFAVYLSMNVFMNIASKNRKERIIMTPLALLTAICFWIIAIGY